MTKKTKIVMIIIHLSCWRCNNIDSINCYLFQWDTLYIFAFSDSMPDSTNSRHNSRIIVIISVSEIFTITNLPTYHKTVFFCFCVLSFKQDLTHKISFKKAESLVFQMEHSLLLNFFFW